MRKLKDELKVLSYLKQGCNTIASISQYKYSKYLLRANALKKILTDIKSSLSISIENLKSASYILFISFVDYETHKIFKETNKSRIFVVASSGIIKILEASYGSFSYEEIDLRKMRSFNTINYENKLIKNIRKFADKADAIYIYFMKNYGLTGNSSIDSFNFWTNTKLFPMSHLDIYYNLICLLSLLYANEFTNNKNAIEKINEMISSKKSQIKKELSKNTNYYSLM